MSLNFGQALEHLKSGGKVARVGWNGKGMWLALMPGYPDGVPANAVMAKAAGIDIGTTVRIQPYIVLRSVDGSFVPWVTSQADVLAEDWTRG